MLRSDYEIVSHSQLNRSGFWQLSLAACGGPSRCATESCGKVQVKLASFFEKMQKQLINLQYKNIIKDERLNEAESQIQIQEEKDYLPAGVSSPILNDRWSRRKSSSKSSLMDVMGMHSASIPEYPFQIQQSQMHSTLIGKNMSSDMIGRPPLRKNHIKSHTMINPMLIKRYSDEEPYSHIGMLNNFISPSFPSGNSTTINNTQLSVQTPQTTKKAKSHHKKNAKSLKALINAKIPQLPEKDLAARILQQLEQEIPTTYDWKKFGKIDLTRNQNLSDLNVAQASIHRSAEDLRIHHRTMTPQKRLKISRQNSTISRGSEERKKSPSRSSPSEKTVSDDEIQPQSEVEQQQHLIPMSSKQNKGNKSKRSFQKSRSASIHQVNLNLPVPNNQIEEEKEPADNNEDREIQKGERRSKRSSKQVLVRNHSEQIQEDNYTFKRIDSIPSVPHTLNPNLLQHIMPPSQDIDGSRINSGIVAGSLQNPKTQSNSNKQPSSGETPQQNSPRFKEVNNFELNSQANIRRESIQTQEMAGNNLQESPGNIPGQNVQATQGSQGSSITPRTNTGIVSIQETPLNHLNGFHNGSSIQNPHSGPEEESKNSISNVSKRSVNSFASKFSKGSKHYGEHEQIEEETVEDDLEPVQATNHKYMKSMTLAVGKSGIKPKIKKTTTTEIQPIKEQEGEAQMISSKVETSSHQSSSEGGIIRKQTFGIKVAPLAAGGVMKKNDEPPSIVTFGIENTTYQSKNLVDAIKERLEEIDQSNNESSKSDLIELIDQQSKNSPREWQLAPPDNSNLIALITSETQAEKLSFNSNFEHPQLHQVDFQALDNLFESRFGEHRTPNTIDKIVNNFFTAEKLKEVEVEQKPLPKQFTQEELQLESGAIISYYHYSENMDQALMKRVSTLRMDQKLKKKKKNFQRTMTIQNLENQEESNNDSGGLITIINPRENRKFRKVMTIKRPSIVEQKPEWFQTSQMGYGKNIDLSPIFKKDYQMAFHKKKSDILSQSDESENEEKKSPQTHEKITLNEPDLKLTEKDNENQESVDSLDDISDESISHRSGSTVESFEEDVFYLTSQAEVNQRESLMLSEPEFQTNKPKELILIKNKGNLKQQFIETMSSLKESDLIDYLSTHRLHFISIKPHLMKPLEYLTTSRLHILCDAPTKISQASKRTSSLQQLLKKLDTFNLSPMQMNTDKKKREYLKQKKINEITKYYAQLGLSLTSVIKLGSKKSCKEECKEEHLPEQQSNQICDLCKTQQEVRIQLQCIHYSINQYDAKKRRRRSKSALTLQPSSNSQPLHFSLGIHCLIQYRTLQSFKDSIRKAQMERFLDIIKVQHFKKSSLFHSIVKLGNLYFVTLPLVTSSKTTHLSLMKAQQQKFEQLITQMKSPVKEKSASMYSRFSIEDLTVLHPNICMPIQLMINQIGNFQKKFRKLQRSENLEDHYRSPILESISQVLHSKVFTCMVDKIRKKYIQVLPQKVSILIYKIVQSSKQELMPIQNQQIRLKDNTVLPIWFFIKEEVMSAWIKDKEYNMKMEIHERILQLQQQVRYDTTTMTDFLRPSNLEDAVNHVIYTRYDHQTQNKFSLCSQFGYIEKLVDGQYYSMFQSFFYLNIDDFIERKAKICNKLSMGEKMMNRLLDGLIFKAQQLERNKQNRHLYSEQLRSELRKSQSIVTNEMPEFKSNEIIKRKATIFLNRDSIQTSSVNTEEINQVSPDLSVSEANSFSSEDQVEQNQEETKPEEKEEEEEQQQPAQMLRRSSTPRMNDLEMIRSPFTNHYVEKFKSTLEIIPEEDELLEGDALIPPSFQIMENSENYEAIMESLKFMRNRNNESRQLKLKFVEREIKSKDQKLSITKGQEYKKLIRRGFLRQQSLTAQKKKMKLKADNLQLAMQLKLESIVNVESDIENEMMPSCLKHQNLYCLLTSKQKRDSLNFILQKSMQLIFTELSEIREDYKMHIIFALRQPEKHVCSEEIGCDKKRRMKEIEEQVFWPQMVTIQRYLYLVEGGKLWKYEAMTREEVIQKAQLTNVNVNMSFCLKSYQSPTSQIKTNDCQFCQMVMNRRTSSTSYIPVEVESNPDQCKHILEIQGLDMGNTDFDLLKVAKQAPIRTNTQESELLKKIQVFKANLQISQEAKQQDLLNLAARTIQIEQWKKNNLTMLRNKLDQKKKKTLNSILSKKRVQLINTVSKTNYSDDIISKLNSLDGIRDIESEHGLKGIDRFRNFAFSLIKKIKRMKNVQTFEQIAMSVANTATKKANRMMQKGKLVKAIEKNQISIIQEFVQNNVQLINIQDQNGFTLLCCATFYGRHEIVDILLRNGANPNIPVFHTMNTPLHIAVSQNFKKIQDLLVEAGANEHAKNRHGLMPWEGTFIPVENEEDQNL